MRMPIGPLGQWESPTVEHGQHHSDTVGTQLKMVQQKFMFNLWFVSKETIKLSVWLIKHHAMKAYEEAQICVYVFFIQTVQTDKIIYN